MRAFQIVVGLVGVSQIVLGLIYLFAPAWFIGWQGLAVPDAQINYPLAMLAGRFLIYGVGMFVIARRPAENRFWLDGMIAIQAIDLAAGIYYTTVGIVPVGDALIPMVNATAFIGLMLWVRRPGTHATTA